MVAVFGFEQIITLFQHQGGVNWIVTAVSHNATVEHDTYVGMAESPGNAVHATLRHMQSARPIRAEGRGGDAVELFVSIVDGDTAHGFTGYNLSRRVCVDIPGKIALGRHRLLRIKGIAPGLLSLRVTV